MTSDRGEKVHNNKLLSSLIQHTLKSTETFPVTSVKIELDLIGIRLKNKEIGSYRIIRGSGVLGCKLFPPSVGHCNFCLYGNYSGEHKRQYKFQTCKRPI